MHIALIGAGKMGSALLRQWANASKEEMFDARFTVIDPQAEPEDAELAESYFPVTIVNALEDLDGPQFDIPQFDIVIVAVKPQIVDSVLPAFANHLASDGIVVSIAAGVSISRLSDLVGVAPVVRVMPNLPAAIGAGVSGLCAGKGVSERHKDVVQRLMEVTGKILWVEDEDKLDRLTAVSGSGPGYIFEIARTYVEAAVELGFSNFEARRLVLGTISGAAEMAMESDQSLEALRCNVTSKNGTTEAGLEALNGDRVLDQRLQATVGAAYRRAVELR